MAKKKEEVESKLGSYFRDKPPLEFISSGCTILDCVIGGGYPLGRVVNIVGDKSSGKTLLAIEAFANFAEKYPNGSMYYHEAESAFDIEYAEALGMPVGKVQFIEEDTIEEFFSAISEVIEVHKESKEPAIYILDSLDALSDKAEKERGIEEGSFAMTKQKKLSEIFRRIISDLEKTRVCLVIISQVRDNIGVMFGEKYKRSGGKALDFYASQIIWLSEVEKLIKTIRGIKRPTGIKVRANCKKNKISAPFRTCDFPIIFGYGIDDKTASIEFLKTVKDGIEGIDENSLKEVISTRVKQIWEETEEAFMPKERKYK